MNLIAFLFGVFVCTMGAFLFGEILAMPYVWIVFNLIPLVVYGIGACMMFVYGREAFKHG